MQNRFVGDIGDFANNGLLRYLSGLTGPKLGKPLRLGLVWYFNEPDAAELRRQPFAGNKIGYLNTCRANDARYGGCDPDLYRALRVLVGESLLESNERSICQIKQSGILPKNTLYYSDPLNGNNRAEWFAGALRKTAAADMIFVNPDIGIGSNRQANSPAHVTMDELQQLARNRGRKSLIIYQHLGQGRGTAEERIEHKANQLNEALQPPYRPLVLRWRSEVGRAYFIVPLTEEHEFLLRIKTMVLLSISNWSREGNFTKA